VGDGEVVALDIEDLGVVQDSGDDPYEYTVVAYSPTENHRMVQAQKLQQYMPVLLNNPIIDQKKLFEKVFEVMGMESLVTQEEQAPAMPGGPADGTQQAPPPNDGLEAGGTPGGLDSALVDGMSPLADGPALPEV
jgi:hypothetical protein